MIVRKETKGLEWPIRPLGSRIDPCAKKRNPPQDEKKK